MSVARPRHILRARAILKRQRALRNYLASVGTNDVDAQYPVGLGVREELDHAIGIEVGLGTRVCREGELANLVLDTCSLELLLGLADPSNLRVGIHNGGYSLVVDVAVTLADVLNGGTSLLFGLVCEHRSESDVTDTFDALDGSVELVIDNNAALGIDFDANLVETETVGVGTTADRDENDISVELLRL